MRNPLVNTFTVDRYSITVVAEGCCSTATKHKLYCSWVRQGEKVDRIRDRREDHLIISHYRRQKYTHSVEREVLSRAGLAWPHRYSQSLLKRAKIQSNWKTRESTHWSRTFHFCIMLLKATLPKSEKYSFNGYPSILTQPPNALKPHKFPYLVTQPPLPTNPKPRNPSSSFNLLIHTPPPPPPKPLHRPNHPQTTQPPQTANRHQPPISNRPDNRRRNQRPDTREDVSDEIVDGDAGGGFTGHEFREHGGGHGED